jgi:hypothetical protein
MVKRQALGRAAAAGLSFEACAHAVGARATGVRCTRQTMR